MDSEKKVDRRPALRRIGISTLGLVTVGIGASLALLDASEAQLESATQPVAPSFEAPGTRSFADVIEQVSPAVVNISVTKLARAMPTGAPRSGGATPFDDFFGRFFGSPGESGPMPGRPRQAQGQGSGFVIDADGFIATNHHVVDGAESIVVTLASGEALDAEVVGSDPQTDIALLRVDPADADLASDLVAVAFGDSDRTRVGDWVLAIGNPFGLGGSATAGIVSARGRDISSGPYDDFLQIDAPINSGNSGGPVFNAAGEVIGINTAIFSPNGGNIGIGFAIPSAQADLILAQLREDGSVTRGWLGVQIQPVDSDLADVFGLEDAGGVLIAEVLEDGPAERAGLEVGDIVRAVDGEDVDSPRELARAVGLHDAGDRVALEVFRDGRTRSLSVALGERERERVAGRRPADSRPANPRTDNDFGLRLEDLNAENRNQFGLSQRAEGALVTAVSPGSPAAARGLRPGDVIVSVDRRRTPDADSVLAALEVAGREGEQALVLIRRDDGQRFVTLGLA